MAATARRTSLSLLALFAAAHAAGAALIFVYLHIVLPRPEDQTAFALVSLLLFTLVVGPFAFLRVTNILRPINKWLRAAVPAQGRERIAVMRAPWRLALTGLTYWLLAAVVFTAINVVKRTPRLETAQEAAGILIGGITVCALVLVLAERVMRPLFAEVLTGAPHSRAATIGIRPRLIGAWLLGSGVPMLAILGAQLRPAGLTAGDRRAAVIFLAATGLAIGAFGVAIAAGSVADPIDRVRTGLQQVHAGDLTVRLAVDDGGELGLLQAGFNEMVDGLRERQRVQELFGRHVGEDVARQAVEGAEELGGEIRNATVLFVDLVRSSALASERSPQEVVTVLNDFFAAVVSAVGAEGGWVNKFEGDGALCVFGAPLDSADHAAQGLRAARALRTALADLRASRGGLDAGIGVSTGEVVAGNVGTSQRYEYTVIGDPVNEAARLTEAAKTTPTRVLVSSRTIVVAGAEAVNWRDAGSFDLRGRPEPARGFTLVLTAGAG